MKQSIPQNAFKKALREGRPQIGLWSSLCSALSVEVIAGSGFDWILIDTEHAPNELPDVLGQLQAMVGGTASPIVRPAWNDPVLIKRFLDVGAQNLLVPYVQTVDEARAAVRAIRYPPDGMRGVSVSNRANQYGRVTEYFEKYQEQLCLFIQIETRLALQNLDAIAALEGIDGLFIGPADLSADLGYLGQPTHAAVRPVIADAIRRIHAQKKISGILAPQEAEARHWLGAGCLMVGVGSDLNLLARHSEELAARYKPTLRS